MPTSHSPPCPLSARSFLQGGEDLTSIPVSIEIAGKDVCLQETEDRYKGMINFYIEVKDQSKTVYQISDRLEMNLKEETYNRRLSDSYR